MMNGARRMAAPALLAVCAASTLLACASSEPAAPPSAPPSTPPAAAPAVTRPSPSEADVRFMQGMIPHHAQALDMTALVPERTTRRELRLMAERIEVSQTDEIAWMMRWLQNRGAAVPVLSPAPHGAGHAGHGDGHAGHHALMPGMLTPEEMAQLAAATGPAFDRLFLTSMIRHHEGALRMVEDLLATPGAAQPTEVYQFATDVQADQQAEIGRMRALLDRLPR